MERFFLSKKKLLNCKHVRALDVNEAMRAVAQRAAARAPEREAQASTNGAKLVTNMRASMVTKTTKTGTQDSTNRRIDITAAAAAATAAAARPEVVEFIVFGAVKTDVALPTRPPTSMHTLNASGPRPVRAASAAAKLTNVIVAKR
jgi:hypothetical protein